MRARRGAISLCASAALLAAALFVAAPGARADEDSSVQRYLIHLHLGESLRQVQQLYAPAQDWPSYMEPRGHVKRVRVERAYLKKPDPHVETMWFGFKRNSLVEIQLIYDRDYSRSKTAEQLAGDWALIYGEPKRTDDGRYYWADGSTVLTVFNAEVPALQGQEQAVELRTSIRLIDRGLWERVD